MIEIVCDALADLPPAVAIGECASWLDELSNTELAALLHDWEQTWARENQIIPLGPWRSYGYLTARRVGKTRSLAEFVNLEAQSGRAMRIGFMAQNEDKTFEVMVEGEAGLIACSPPWFKARWERGRVVWPNGAQAFPFTPEVPGAIRGPGVHLFWASEVQSWPQAQREEAWHNASLMTSLGYAKTVWDATPKKRHPILRMLLSRAKAEPDRHTVIRGSIRDNEDNLAEEVIRDLETAMTDPVTGKLTQRGREELGGEYIEQSSAALWQQEWIDNHRRKMPTELVRRILVIDPAISTREGTDPTGMVELGLGVDKQVLVLGDQSDRHQWEAWGKLAVETYLSNRLDLIVVERNRGGDACAGNIRAAAKERELVLGTPLIVQVIAKDDPPPVRHNPQVIYVREIIGRGAKDVRAEPVASLAERGRISHVLGADLSALEDEQTTWEPDGRNESPNRLDAMVHGVWELARLGDNTIDPAIGMRGIQQAQRELLRPATERASLAELLISARRGSDGGL